MRELKFSKGDFDGEHEFKVDGVTGSVSLEKDLNTLGDGIIWGLQSPTVIKSSYTAEEIEHKARLRDSTPIENGELVLIESEVYVADLQGDYSTCIIFNPWNGKVPDKNGYYLIDLERSLKMSQLIFWKPNSHGYTEYISDAGVYSETSASKKVNNDISNLTVKVKTDVVKEYSDI